jgi:hypothetical protein
VKNVEDVTVPKGVSHTGRHLLHPPLNKSVLPVHHILLLAILLDEQACLAKVVSWHPREEMVGHLKVKASVNKLDRRRAFDVHCGPDLPRREGLDGPEVVRRACKVREYNLPCQFTLTGPDSIPEHAPGWCKCGLQANTRHASSRKAETAAWRQSTARRMRCP